MRNASRVGAAALLLAAGAAFIVLAGRSGTNQPGADAQAAASVAAMTVDPAVARAEALLARASAAYSEGRIAAPAGDNAAELFLAARAAMPGNTVAREALADLQPALASAARAALNDGNNDEAGRIAALLEQAAPGSLQAHEIRTELQGLTATLPVASVQPDSGSSRSVPRRGGAVGHSASAL